MLSLPLPLDELPEALRRFCDPSAPERTRQMVARGLLPLRGTDLVIVLLQLTADPASQVAASASETLLATPPGILDAACDAGLHPALLDGLARLFREDGDRLERLLSNPALASETVVDLARTCSERVAERIALDEQRLLQAPAIIESLYKNRATRMSTVDRLIDLAVRNGIVLENVHTFEAHAQAIQGQLIPEPSEEPLPGDADFNVALDIDGIEDALNVDAVDGAETVKEKYLPLAFRIQNMTFAEKLRLCLVGNAAARALLVRDPNKLVSMSAVASPQMTEAEAGGIATSRQVGEEILRYIGNRREWMGSYEIKRSLVFNPKTPVGTSMRFVSHLHMADLRILSRSRGIPAALKSMALQRVMKKGGSE